MVPESVSRGKCTKVRQDLETYGCPRCTHGNNILKCRAAKTTSFQSRSCKTTSSAQGFALMVDSCNTSWQTSWLILHILLFDWAPVLPVSSAEQACDYESPSEDRVSEIAEISEWLMVCSSLPRRQPVPCKFTTEHSS